MIELIKSGEPFLFANMFVILFSIALTVQRVHTLWLKLGRSADEMLDRIVSYVQSGSYAQALQLCSSSAHPMGEVLKEALSRANRSEKEIKRGVEVAAIRELPKIKKGTGYMPQLSNIATLFGLIGTIRGLIISFSGVSGGDAATRQSMLSEGISIAFYNTFFGLTVAVLIIVAYMFILGRQNRVLADMELGTARLIDQILVRQAMEREGA